MTCISQYQVSSIAADLFCLFRYFKHMTGTCCSLAITIVLATRKLYCEQCSWAFIPREKLQAEPIKFMVLSSNWIVCHPAVVWVVGEALLDVGLENLRQRDVLNGVWKALPNECACFGGWGRGGSFSSLWYAKELPNLKNRRWSESVAIKSRC